MIKIFNLVYLFLLIVGLITCQNKINSGLVAYYPFNGDAKDYSGNNNHGVVDGPVLTTDRFGQDNSAFRFDGIKAMVEANVKDMPAINAEKYSTEELGIELFQSGISNKNIEDIISALDQTDRLCSWY